ncbi:class I SAM-dependent methyltransferase [Nonomuraea sp. NPDC048901]|uniref:class I SAM-dependent methyltransferase n=1 Tax=Nonomuraea sp. NPDC048901 TaxID=3155627 RepID=UPI003405781F
MKGLDRFRPYGLRDSLERYFNLENLARAALGLGGEFAECGAFYGGSTYVLLRALSEAPLRLHVFESFRGLPPPGPKDDRRWKEGDFRSSDKVFLELTRDYAGNLCLHTGDVQTSLPHLADRRFGFAHVDLDLYESTKYAMTFFLPRLVAGGVIVCDDYGFPTESGAKAAVDQTCAAAGARVIPLSSGQAVVVGCPPSSGRGAA